MAEIYTEKPTYEMLEERIKVLESSVALIDTLKEEIKEKNLFLEMLFDAIPNPIFYKDRDCVYQNCNDAFTKIILGIPKEEIIGKSLYDLPEYIPKELADIYYQKDQELFNNPGSQCYETKVLCSDGVTRYYNFYKATFTSENGEVLGIIGIMLDISHHREILSQLDEKNKRLNELSITDGLTQVYNRRYFQEVFENKIDSLYKEEKYFAFMMIDIDYFKEYNDTFGHYSGDKALISVAEAIKKHFSEEEYYSFRLGGEEFAVLYNFRDTKSAIQHAKKFVHIVESLKIEAGKGHDFPFLTISSGLYLLKSIPYDKLLLTHIYNKVDSLLYRAKNEGRNRLLYKVIE